ncbi:MAG: RNA polymerase sigma factor [Deltaproteobacteria bacterium]|nr:RNA polymerase sigma factor [Deltaproteobacteria bacterium]
MSRALEHEPHVAAEPRSAEAGASASDTLAAKVAREHHQVVWRLLRRLGLSVADADDVTQETFVAVVGKVDRIEPGKEKAFVLGVAIRIAQRRRQASNRQAQRSVSIDDHEMPSTSPAADAVMEHNEALALLDRVLASMDDDLRAVFVLYELEELTMAEIAIATTLPPGTVASRLRRAREAFQSAVKRTRERMR